MDKLDLILTKLNKLEKDIDLIKSELDIIKKQTSKMDKHVDFVENVYTKVEYPLHYVCDKFNYLVGNQNENACIENKNQYSQEN